jgi:predicted NAD/FAD-binding protein
VKIAIIGSGVAGNVVAHHLYRDHDIHVFEAGSHVGGHAHTHDIELAGRHYAVDTGFIVFNHQTYPHFSALLRELGVESQDSTMSFSVRCERTGLEYNGTTVNALFAQRRNLLRPGFWRMIREILRFNREAPELLRESVGPAEPDIPLGDYLQGRRYSREFLEWYILPMGAAIWSTDPARMLDFPARCFVRFFQNHGMLTVNDRPQWRTVRGGSREYVRRLTAPFATRIRLDSPVQGVRRRADGVTLWSRHGEERFDQVFFACHSDQALRLLQDPSPLEATCLAAIPYQASEMVLHTDASLLPRRPRAWAAWNYHLLPEGTPCQHSLQGLARAATVTYNMNILQRIQAPETFCVTLNRTDAIDPRRVLRRLTYHHPVYTPAGLEAQRRHGEVNGAHRSYFCGAYWRYGFHEDGVVSALAALTHFRARESVEVAGLDHQLAQPAGTVHELTRDYVGHPGLAL